MLPQSSVELHVRVIVLSCGHVPAAVTSVKFTVGEASQLSVDVGFPVLAGNVLAVHSIVTLIGQTIDGGALSSTVITCKQVPVFPQSSVADQVLFIVRSCGHEPPTVTSVKAIVGEPSQLSVAVAVPVLMGNVLSVH